MGWGDRETGYAVLQEPRIERLAALPAGVGCRVFAYPKPDRPAWFITVAAGMRPGRKWDGSTAFGEPQPDGAPRYRRALRELAAPFVQAIDALAEEDRGPNGPGTPGCRLGSNWRRCWSNRCSAISRRWTTTRWPRRLGPGCGGCSGGSGG